MKNRVLSVVMILTGFFVERDWGDHESASWEKSNCAPFFSDFRPAACNGGLDLFHFSSPADRARSKECGANRRRAAQSRLLRARRNRLNQRRKPAQNRPVRRPAQRPEQPDGEPVAPQPPGATAPQPEAAATSCPPEYVPLIQKTTAALMTANFTFYPGKGA